MSFRDVLRRGAATYPPLLAAIPDPPAALWLRGAAAPELLARPAVAVVGARACSSYGRSVARTLGRELAAAGLVVVSGLARGIDGEAHRGALDAGGMTVAVLGCGIDRDYPAAHRELAAPDRRDGLIVSEYERGRRAGAVALSGAEPDHRRPLRGDRGRRGTRAVRRADHRRLRARGRPRGDGRAGRDHVRGLGRVERAAAARRDAGHGGGRRARGVRDRARAEQPSRRPAGSRALLERLARAARPASTSSRGRSDCAPGEVAAALIELELAGRVSEEDGVYRVTMRR